MESKDNMEPNAWTRSQEDRLQPQSVHVAFHLGDVDTLLKPGSSAQNYTYTTSSRDREAEEGAWSRWSRSRPGHCLTPTRRASREVTMCLGYQVAAASLPSSTFHKNLFCGTCNQKNTGKGILVNVVSLSQADRYIPQM